MGIIADVFSTIREDIIDRKKTIDIFKQISNNKDEIVKSLKSISEINWKKSKFEEENLPSFGIRGSKEWDSLVKWQVRKEKNEIELYNKQLNNHFKIHITEIKHIEKVIRYVKDKNEFYKLESSTMVFGKNNYLKKLKRVLKDV